MSVIVVVRIKVADVTKVKEVFTNMSTMMREVAGVGKQSGALHHRFLESEGEIIVLDEWDSAESFQKFFSSNDKIGQIMAASGAIGEPNVEFFKTIETADQF